MGSKRVVYTKDDYEGIAIMDKARYKKGKVNGFYKSMLDGLFKLAYYAIDGSGYQRPSALMLSFAFTEESHDYPISGVMTKIWNSFSKSRLPKHDNDGNKIKHGRKPENCFKPLYLWCRETKLLAENDPEFKESLTVVEKERYKLANQDGCPIPYEHYHLVIVLDDKFGTWLSIKTVMDALVKTGVVRAGYHFSRNNKTKEKTLNLKDNEEFEQFLYRAAYVCKTDTKELTNKKFWSASQCKRKQSNPIRRKIK